MLSLMQACLVVIAICSVHVMAVDQQQQNTIEQLSNIFDHASSDTWYSYCEKLTNANDRPYFLAGRSPFSSQDGSMLQVLVQYQALQPTNALVPYMNALAILFASSTDGTLYDEKDVSILFSPTSTFVIDWYLAARDQLFRQAQDSVHMEFFYNYVGQHMSRLGMDRPLSYSILYDTMMQTGDDVEGLNSHDSLTGMLLETAMKLGQVGQQEVTPATGIISEQAFMAAFLAVRKAHLLNSPMDRLVNSVERIRVYMDLVRMNLWDLPLPLSFTLDKQSYTIVDDREQRAQKENLPSGLAAVYALQPHHGSGVTTPATPTAAALNEVEALTNSPNIVTDTEKGIDSTSQLDNAPQFADVNKVTLGLPYGVAGILPPAGPNFHPIPISLASFADEKDSPAAYTPQQLSQMSPVRRRLLGLLTASSFIDYKKIHSAFKPLPNLTYKLSTVSNAVDHAHSDVYNTHDHAKHASIPSFRHPQGHLDDQLIVTTPLGLTPVKTASSESEVETSDGIEVPIVSAVQPPASDEDTSSSHSDEHTKDNAYNTVNVDHSRHHHYTPSVAQL